MDFFEHQEKARKKSGLLVIYFILAVIGIICSVYVVISIATGFIEVKGGGNLDEDNIWNAGLFTATAVGTLGVILLGSGYKTLQLAGGGPVVAKQLGGRRIDNHTTDFHEKRLMNVVEEMAIASGVPVPEVYVMDGEDCINAFAAGKTTSDAVIGVSRGCMKLLSRDELQGVIAHEFSHILNGDMKLNMRLIGLLFGILFIAMIGQIMLRSAAHGARFSRNKESGGGALAFMLVGLAIMLVGYVGLFFGKLIKAAVSRQREFLADASAVQFTRNPDGIGGALKKIGGLQHGSRIENPLAEEASHLFFGNAMRGFSSALATHPPLNDRIQRIDPSWNGKFPKTRLPEISTSRKDFEKEEKRHREAPVSIPGFPDMRGGGGVLLGLSESEAIESMNRVHPEQIAYSQQIRSEFPEEWVNAAHSESGAQALVFALLLAQDDELRGEELSHLREATDENTYLVTVKLHREIASLHSAAKLALVDLAIPSLRHLSPNEYQRFRSVIDYLMESDKQIDLFEFTLQKVIRRHLDNFFGRGTSQRIRYRKIAALQQEAAVLLTTMGHLGHADDSAKAEEAFRLGAALIEAETRGPMALQPPERCGLREIEVALDKFAHATPLVKKRLLYACGKTVMADEKVTSDEAELIRAIADAIGCPIPPFVKTIAAAVS